MVAGQPTTTAGAHELGLERDRLLARHRRGRDLRQREAQELLRAVRRQVGRRCSWSRAFNRLDLDADDVQRRVTRIRPGPSARPRAWGVGLNWIWNNNLKYVLDYEQTSFKGGAAARRRSRHREERPDPPAALLLEPKRGHRMRTHFCPTRSWPASCAVAGSARAASVELLNVSYDPTRELWRDINEQLHRPVPEGEGRRRSTIKQSHGGSSTQARAVIDGLEADVVTLASVHRHRRHRPARAHHRRLGRSGCPTTRCPTRPRSSSWCARATRRASRTGRDLVKPGVEIITPNPKTSGNGYLSFFSAWGSVVLRGGSRKDAVDYVTKLYKQVPVLDSGARGATTTFVQRGIGDVHLAWENEARLEVRGGEGRPGHRLSRRSASGPSRTSRSWTPTWTARRRARRPRPT